MYCRLWDPWLSEYWPSALLLSHTPMFSVLGQIGLSSETRSLRVISRSWFPQPSRDSQTVGPALTPRPSFPGFLMYCPCLSFIFQPPTQNQEKDTKKRRPKQSEPNREVSRSRRNNTECPLLNMGLQDLGYGHDYW